LLAKIFGEQEEINLYGVYLINVYVNNQWRLVIVDDYVPVVKRKRERQEA